MAASEVIHQSKINFHDLVEVERHVNFRENKTFEAN